MTRACPGGEEVFALRESEQWTSILVRNATGILRVEDGAPSSNIASNIRFRPWGPATHSFEKQKHIKIHKVCMYINAMQRKCECKCDCICKWICKFKWNCMCNVCVYYSRRKFRSQTSDNMHKWKAKSQRREEKKKEDQKRESLKRKKIQVREKVGKSRNTLFFQWFVSGGSKSRLAKAAGAEPAGQMRDEKLHAVVARSTFPSQNVQNTPCSDHLRCLKVHAVVVRSTFRSQNAQKAPASDHFWKLRCGKSARRCGAKQISKSKCTKHTSFGPLLEVEMSKKCTPLWREADFEVKHTRSGPLLEVEMSKKCTPFWREAHFEVKMWKTPGVRTTFGDPDVVSRGRRKGFCTLSKVNKKVRVLWHFQKRWQAWDIWRRSAKMHFPWQAQYKRHVHQSC